MQIGHSKSNVSYLFPWKLQPIQKTQWHYWIEPMLSYKTLFFNAVTTIRYAFSPAMNKSLHVTLIQSVQLSRMWLVFHVTAATAEKHHPPPHCAQVGLHKCSASIDDCLWVPFFLHGGIQWHTFASSALPCQMPFCQTASLLPSVRWHQKVMEYW